MDKNFVAVGKMTIGNLGAEWNIPDLHFIVNKTPSGNFEATNIEFILDTCGNSIEDAVKVLVRLTVYYITAVMEKGRGYIEFMDKANSLVMEDYWRAYRNFEFSLAGKGKDLGRDIAGAVKTVIGDINIRIAVREAA